MFGGAAIGMTTVLHWQRKSQAAVLLGRPAWCLLWPLVYASADSYSRQARHVRQGLDKLANSPQERGLERLPTPSNTVQVLAGMYGALPANLPCLKTLSPMENKGNPRTFAMAWWHDHADTKANSANRASRNLTAAGCYAFKRVALQMVLSHS